MLSPSFCRVPMLVLTVLLFPGLTQALPASITITCDNLYDLYVNGAYVGSQNNADGTWGWDVPELWYLDIPAGDLTIAVRGEDFGTGSGIGLIAYLELFDSSIHTTDGSWLVSADATAGWEQPGFDDSAWSPAFVQGGYASIPWTLFAPPIGQFASSSAMWIWRGTPPFSPGYGYYNDGNFGRCFFRKRLFVAGPTPAQSSTFGRIKAIYR